MARGDRGQVIAVNPTSDGWSLGSSSSNEQGTCLRDTEVVEMVNTPMIVTGLNNSVDGGTYHLQNKGIYRKMQVCKENNKSETQV